MDVVDGTLRIDPHLNEGWGHVQLNNIAVGARAEASIRG
jgi:hypothetical protein